jgi:hypothetical protein
MKENCFEKETNLFLKVVAFLTQNFGQGYWAEMVVSPSPKNNGSVWTKHAMD